MPAPREVVQSSIYGLPFTLPTAAAWLLGYVRTDAPGYRELQVGSTLALVASGEYRFDALVDACTTAGPGGVSFSWSTDGTVGADTTTTFPDRLGWVLGIVGDAGDTGANTIFIPPAGIPLLGATWLRVDSEADRREIIDRHRRNQGYVWGAALIWRCKLTMHRWALEALQTGWCLRGKVTLAGATMLSTPVSVSEPTGAITGYALGLDSVRWLDSIQHHAEVEMSIVSE